MNFSYTYDPKTMFITKQENNTTARIPQYDSNNNTMSEEFVIDGDTYNNTYSNAEFGTLNNIEKI
ncbi:hypothetical protein BC1_00021 [Bacillus phage BC-1]|nr:hypothetical protein BC1_00021 [Bacillus phage BC-1]